MKAKKFIPVYLYSDDFKIKNATEKYYKGAEVLNQFIEMIEEAVREHLSDEEKVKIKEEGMQFIIDGVRAKFPFPDATDDFNLQAIGIDLKPLKQFYDRMSPHWRGQQYNLSEGLFLANETQITELVEKHKYYTQNEKQNIALILAEELRENIIKAEEAGFIDRFNKTDISNITPLLSYDYHGLKINHHHIINLK